LRKHSAAERTCAHLRAEADAEERLVVVERHGDPVDLTANEFVVVVGAHRAAENRRSRMTAHRIRQRIAEARASHVKFETEPAQLLPDAARAGMLLVKDDQDRLQHIVNRISAPPAENFYRLRQ